MNPKLLVVLFLGFSACASANLVSETYEPNRRGIVKIKGSWFESGADKSDVVMTDFCKPNGYKITSQRYSGETVGMTASTYGNITQVSPSTATYLYVHFRCSDSDQPSTRHRHRRANLSPEAAVPESSDREQCKSDCVSKVQSGEITDPKVCADACP